MLQTLGECEGNERVLIYSEGSDEFCVEAGLIVGTYEDDIYSAASLIVLVL